MTKNGVESSCYDIATAHSTVISSSYQQGSLRNSVDSLVQISKWPYSMFPISYFPSSHIQKFDIFVIPHSRFHRTVSRAPLFMLIFHIPNFIWGILPSSQARVSAHGFTVSLKLCAETLAFEGGIFHARCGGGDGETLAILGTLRMCRP